MQHAPIYLICHILQMAAGIHLSSHSLFIMYTDSEPIHKSNKINGDIEAHREIKTHTKNAFHLDTLPKGSAYKHCLCEPLFVSLGHIGTCSS